MSDSSAHLGSAHVLVVDDEKMICEGIAGLLERAGYRCSVAYDGRQGLEKIHEAHPLDLILTDLRMPVMDGIQFVNEVRSLKSQIPIVVVTSNIDIDSAIECLRAGANDYIQKPFDTDLLRDTVARFVDLNRKRIVSERQTQLEREIVEKLDTMAGFDARDRQAHLLEYLRNKTRSTRIQLMKYSKQDHLLESAEDKWEFDVAVGKLFMSDPIGVMRAKGIIREEHHHLVTLGAEYRMFIVLERQNPAYSEDELDLVNTLIRRLALTIQISGSMASILNEDDLQQLFRLADLSERSASVLHEVMTPLTVALNYSQRLTDSQKLDTESQLYAERSLRALNSVTRIIENARLFFNSTQTSIDAPIHAARLIDNSLMTLEFKFKRRGIQTNRFSPENIMVTCNSQQIEQVLINLISNAIDALENLDVRVFRISCEQSENGVCFEVANPGPPIPDEIISRMFERFYTTKAVGKGTGLGLFISRKIIQGHGSELYYRRSSDENIFGFILK